MHEKNIIKIGFKVLSSLTNKDFVFPEYMTEHSSGMDVCAMIKKDLILETGSVETVPTGFALEIPIGFEAQIRPRSGLAAKYGVGILNTPGTIDADYRGEIKIIMMNFGLDPFKISRGDRIAQMVFAKVYHAEIKLITNFRLSTKRSFGGFGHTGIRNKD